MGVERKSLIISERGEAQHGLPRGRPRAGRRAAAATPTRSTRSPSSRAAWRSGSPCSCRWTTSTPTQGVPRSAARHSDGRPHRRGDLHAPHHHRRRQRHRARHRSGAQDGVRVGHERDWARSPSARRRSRSSSAGRSPSTGTTAKTRPSRSTRRSASWWKRATSAPADHRAALRRTGPDRRNCCSSGKCWTAARYPTDRRGCPAADGHGAEAGGEDRPQT